MENTMYLRLYNRIKVRPNETIVISDIAQIVAHPKFKQDVENLIIYKISLQDKNYVVIDITKVLEQIRNNFPNLEIQPLGPSQSLIEIIIERKAITPVFFIAIWLLLFFGAALTILNFHEDVSMQEVHQRIYTIITGKEEYKPLLLQIPYSIGLGLGMILFFNHIFRKRINEEPSPLEVEMFNYQQALDQYMIMTENKKANGRTNGS
ncbi:stage V sporulation protein AA [Bacillus luteolus]|uniref:Stage V sporulation protein AA n=1 Tax=Litchfieldia luteola TaxID=682179 RepID=A0ABR9QPF2_9BACI|nr:stage V sporulation protein AA [Cytobacillus luteolus]MBE4910362.1 stage V sporulation protein AA [Cytobacillus luteolus]MBP1942063.1 stage V sporulation protein AA [Cytobacillus luteolus]